MIMLKILMILLILFKLNTSGVIMVRDVDIIIRLLYSDQMPHFKLYHKSRLI